MACPKKCQQCFINGKHQNVINKTPCLAKRINDKVHSVINSVGHSPSKSTYDTSIQNHPKYNQNVINASSTQKFVIPIVYYKKCMIVCEWKQARRKHTFNYKLQIEKYLKRKTHTTKESERETKTNVWHTCPSRPKEKKRRKKHRTREKKRDYQAGYNIRLHHGGT